MKEMMDIHIASKRLQVLPPAERTPETQTKIQEGRRRLLKIREELIRIQSLLNCLAGGGPAVKSSPIQASQIKAGEIKAGEIKASEISPSEQVTQIRESGYLPGQDAIRSVEPAEGPRADYILVPRTPTEAMLKAGYDEAQEKNASGVWRVMIEAWESGFKDRGLGQGQR